MRNSAPNHQRKILLPISFGLSSVTLLHILNSHLKTQMAKSGRTGFTLSLVFVASPAAGTALPDDERLSAALQQQYPGYEFASLPLHHVFRLVPHDTALLHLIPGLAANQVPSQEQLASLVNSLTSATARVDVITTLRTRLIVEHAKATGCEGILWGDSTTKLAEKTLAETAKGRGFSLPWHIADGETPFGVNFNYPLRDVLKKDLAAYIQVSDPPLAPLVHEPSAGATQASMSSKNTTIDDLMKQYFESVEENFPSIVSNVVRTTTKLEASSNAGSEPTCSLCSMPVAGARFGIHGWGGDQQHDSDRASSVSNPNLCYGCTRSIPPTAATNGALLP